MHSVACECFNNVALPTIRGFERNGGVYMVIAVFVGICGQEMRNML
jgi:hypothetical protein